MHVPEARPVFLNQRSARLAAHAPLSTHPAEPRLVRTCSAMMAAAVSFFGSIARAPFGRASARWLRLRGGDSVIADLKQFCKAVKSLTDKQLSEAYADYQFLASLEPNRHFRAFRDACHDELRRRLQPYADSQIRCRTFDS